MSHAHDVRYRKATSGDAPLLAIMNAQLIRDERHRNPMGPSELEQRMKVWLSGEYEAVVLEIAEQHVGYALYRREGEHIYLRQFFVEPGHRRQGIGRTALWWMRQNLWAPGARIRIDVLVHNRAAIAFWRSLGFVEYCTTMELDSAADSGRK